MSNEFRNAVASVSFYDSQFKGSKEYFLYIIQEGSHAGGGTSCYFWFLSPAQLLNSIKMRMDFWKWRDGWNIAARDLAAIIDAETTPTDLGRSLKANLNSYMRDHAGIHLWAWGTFADLCAGTQPFCAEARKDFREALARANWDADSGSDGQDASRPIAESELDDFVDFLDETPT